MRAAGFACTAAVVCLLCACTTPIDGARAAPPSWIAARPRVQQCEDLAGLYVAEGVPAPQNAQTFLYAIAWPTQGSLPAFIESGMNKLRRRDVSAVRIAFDTKGQPSFSAVGTDGVERGLTARDWWCRKGALETRTSLGVHRSDYDSQSFDEIFIRLLKGNGGTLVAQINVREVTPGRRRAPPEHQLIARFYYRFFTVADRG